MKTYLDLSSDVKAKICILYDFFCTVTEMRPFTPES
jgi:hypothetical protein